MGFIVFMTLPGLVILLTVVAFVSPGRQSEFEERQSALLTQDDEEDGAPPNRTPLSPTASGPVRSGAVRCGPVRCDRATRL